MSEERVKDTKKNKLILLFGTLGSVILMGLGLYVFCVPNEASTIIHGIVREQFDYAATNLFRGGLILLALISFCRHHKDMQKGFLGGYVCICSIADFTVVLITMKNQGLSQIWYLANALFAISLLGLFICYFVISADKDGARGAGKAMNAFLLVLSVLTFAYAIYTFRNGYWLSFVENLGNMFGYLFLGTVANTILLKKEDRKSNSTGGTVV